MFTRFWLRENTTSGSATTTSSKCATHQSAHEQALPKYSYSIFPKYISANMWICKNAQNIHWCQWLAGALSRVFRLLHHPQRHTAVPHTTVVDTVLKRETALFAPCVILVCPLLGCRLGPSALVRPLPSVFAMQRVFGLCTHHAPLVLACALAPVSHTLFASCHTCHHPAPLTSAHSWPPWHPHAISTTHQPYHHHHRITPHTNKRRAKTNHTKRSTHT